MSTFGWFALVILPVLGGLIAWAGDVIGYRLGKSRRSLFGLRPRTTARLIGVAVGVALPLIGVGTALLGSRDARDAVFYIDELRQQQADLIRENRELETRRADASRRAQQSEQQATEFRQELFQTQRVLTGVQGHVARTTRQLQAARDQVRAASANAGRLERVAAATQAMLAPLQERLEKLQTELQGLQTALAKTSTQLADTNQELLVGEAAVKAREADLAVLKQNFEDALRLLSSPVELESGHELVRAIIEVGETQEETEESLLKLLITASRAAALRGATPGPNGLAVRLIRPLPPNTSPEAGLPDQAAILRSFASELQAGGPGTFVIGVRVARRMYRLEAAPVGVELWPSRPRARPYVRAFLENQVIYETEIDGSGSRLAIFTQLYNLVTKIVRREAQENGLLPHPETGEYGTTDFGQLFDALDAIDAHEGPVRVRVLAAQDTFILDPLVIRIEVGDEADGSGSGD